MPQTTDWESVAHSTTVNDGVLPLERLGCASGRRITSYGVHRCITENLGARPERERLLAARLALSPDARAAQTAAVAADLERLIPCDGAHIVSVYWPIRAEPDLRQWMRARCVRGTRVASPVALAHGERSRFVSGAWGRGSRTACEGSRIRPTGSRSSPLWRWPQWSFSMSGVTGSATAAGSSTVRSPRCARTRWR